MSNFALFASLAPTRRRRPTAIFGERGGHVDLDPALPPETSLKLDHGNPIALRELSTIATALK